MMSERPVLHSVKAAVLWTWAVWIGGCGGDARLELAAADALDGLAASLETTVQEYHAEVQAADDERESAVVAAFVTRMRRDAADEETAGRHTVEFAEALRRVRADRGVEWGRYHAVLENVSILQEISRGLQRAALESMSLEDESRRYLRSLMETVSAARRVPASPNTPMKD